MGWGVHDYPGPPLEKPMPVCPECGAECETLYFGRDGSILGCDECIDAKDAADYFCEEDDGC